MEVTYITIYPIGKAQIKPRPSTCYLSAYAASSIWTAVHAVKVKATTTMSYFQIAT
ncbi:MAG: hypothetical protein HS105_10915 [Chloracidobacterium sp.]|nr:hypothetical protein [Chloracidobacterium sp.]MCO5332838.1 hypothetical protein [Pyrinomonadaceae bacterium]